MGDLSANFSRAEFACHCGCGSDTVDAELLTVLQRLREHFATPVEIVSGHRCQTHNRTVGSRHLDARAADIKVLDIPPPQVYAWLDAEYPRRYGIGLYAGWTHIDTRANKARWSA